MGGVWRGHWRLCGWRHEASKDAADAQDHVHEGRRRAPVFVPELAIDQHAQAGMLVE